MYGPIVADAALAVVGVLKQRMAQRIELNPSEVTTSLTKRDVASITEASQELSRRKGRCAGAVLSVSAFERKLLLADVQQDASAPADVLVNAVHEA